MISRAAHTVGGFLRGYHSSGGNAAGVGRRIKPGGVKNSVQLCCNAPARQRPDRTRKARRLQHCSTDRGPERRQVCRAARSVCAPVWRCVDLPAGNGRDRRRQRREAGVYPVSASWRRSKNWAIHSLTVVHIRPRTRYTKMSPMPTSRTVELSIVYELRPGQYTRKRIEPTNVSLATLQRPEHFSS
jgi:hypothetical protein